jgi:Tfp pilus assembly protein PilO
MGATLPLNMPTIKIEAPYRYVLAATGGLCVVLVLVRFLYLPVVAQIRERRVALQELQVKMADVQRVTEELPNQEAAVRKAQERYRLFHDRLGKGQSVARVLEELDALAKEKRLQLITTQSSVEEGSERLVTLGPDIVLREIPLTMQLTGRYRQVAEFLGELDEAPFMATVQRLSLTKPDREESRLKADTTLTVYLADRMPTP